MAQVEIIKVGHALELGARGEKGGKPSRDSIWGVANVSGVLLTFSGRRGAKVLKYKTRSKADLDNVMALWEQKLEGTDVKRLQYTDVSAEHETLVPGLAEQIGKGYHMAKQAGKLNTRSTAKKPAAKKEVAAKPAATKPAKKAAAPKKAVEAALATDAVAETESTLPPFPFPTGASVAATANAQ